jgi:hypothetical protein
LKTTKTLQIKKDSIWKNKFTETFAKVAVNTDYGESFGTIFVYERNGTPGRYSLKTNSYSTPQFTRNFDLVTPAPD